MRKPARRQPAVPAVRRAGSLASGSAGYGDLVGGIAALLEQARRASAWAVNALMTATYWEIGGRIVESEPFYLAWPISQTLSAESEAGRGSRPSPQKSQTPSAISATPSGKSGSGQSVSQQVHSSLQVLAARFPLPWSAYARLLAVRSDEARRFNEAEALRGGWSVRQPDRQIQSQFYERTALSRDKAAMLAKGGHPMGADALWVEEEVKDPYILEFLDLKDEYSESALEEALVRYGLDDLPNKVLAAEYRTALPDEMLLAAEIAETRRRLEARAMHGGKR